MTGKMPVSQWKKGSISNNDAEGITENSPGFQSGVNAREDQMRPEGTREPFFSDLRFRVSLQDTKIIGSSFPGLKSGAVIDDAFSIKRKN